MKKKFSIYLTQNIFIIVLVFFLSWGLSFLITRDIYSIKDNEKVEIFFDTRSIDVEFKNKIEDTYQTVGNLIEKLEFREASKKIMELVEFANKYYDEQEPWKQAKENMAEFEKTIFNCANIIVNLANLYEPIMPEACSKIRKYLNIEKAKWEPTYIENKISLENIEPLFERLK